MKALVPALTAFWTGVVAGLQVTDGPNYDPSETHLMVGWSGGEQAPITVTRQVQDAALSVNKELIDIACLLSFWRGDKTVAQVRDALLDAFDALDTALRADRNLGGLAGVDRVRITDYSIDPDMYETGDKVAMPFIVNVIAWA